jgi:ribonuclease P protein component
MMPALRRLKTRPEFLKVAATGAKWVTPGLVLQARQRPAARPRETAPQGAASEGTPSEAEAEQPRVGFTVSRKVGNAIRRNRARRRLRAAAMEVLPEHGRSGCDYVLIGRAGTLDRRYADLVMDLRTAIERIGERSGTKGSQDRRRRPKGSRGGPGGGSGSGKARSGRGS